MKMKRKSKPKTARLPPGTQKTHEVAQSGIPKEKPQNVYTPMETGQPDQDPCAVQFKMKHFLTELC